ncbi:MAG: hypothetical protein CMN34_01770 [Saprospirales bacterium]|nr:hypothetical protein [Saprospirales bacterium]
MILIGCGVKTIEMNNKFLKSTLRFGLGISLLMTLVACPAASDKSQESDKPHPAESYDLLSYNRSALYKYNKAVEGFQYVNIPNYLLFPGTDHFNEFFFFEEPYTDLGLREHIRLKGPIRLIEELERGYVQNVPNSKHEKIYSFTNNNLLVKVDYVGGGHQIYSYDDNDNLFHTASFDGKGDCYSQDYFDYTYDSNNQILGISHNNWRNYRQIERDADGNAIEGVRKIDTATNNYTYTEVERHSNGYPKIVHSVVNGVLDEVLEFDAAGSLMMVSNEEFTKVLSNDLEMRKEIKYKNDSLWREYQWSFNDSNQLVSKKKWHRSVINNLFFEEELYEYDELGRVSRFTIRKAGETDDLVADFAYDSKGNLVEIKKSYYSNSEPFQYQVLAFEDYDKYGNPTRFSHYYNGALSSVYERTIYYYE